MKQLIDIFLGELEPVKFLSAYIFGIIGVVLSRAYSATTRDPTTSGSPLRFSWAYWIQDNARRVLLVLLVLFVGIRFAPELLGAEVTVYAGLLIGLGIDRIPEILKKKNEK